MSSFRKLTWVELKLVIREPFTLLFVFFFPVIVLLVIAGVFEADEETIGTTTSTNYVAGYIGTVVAALSLVGFPVHVATYRERGILRRFTASSVNSYAWLMSQMTVGLVLSALGGIVLVIAAVLIYEVPAPVSIPGVILTFLIATLAFVALGVMLGVLMPTARSAQGLGLGLFFPMWMLSGTGPPQSVMSDTMRTISDALPMTWMVNALQEAWNESGFDALSVAILLGLLVITGAVTLPRMRSVAGGF